MGKKVQATVADGTKKWKPIIYARYSNKTFTQGKIKVAYDKNGFPKYKRKFQMTISNKYLKYGRGKHFTEANKVLKAAYKKNPKEFKKKFTKNELKDIEKGKTPRNHTWHHHQDRGKMQLVDSEDHKAAKHTGGIAIWGQI